MPHTLLLADDSVTIQRVIELTFADEDIKVIAVSDGDQAIAHLEAAPPDIVLADIGMPGKNGYEVAEYIKKSPRLAHIPVVLLTGAFEPVDQVKATAAGCDGVLAKPFEPQQVIERVKELLARQGSPASLAANLAPASEPSPAAHIDLVPAGGQLSLGADPKIDDYFDRLDAAFATLSTPSSVELPMMEVPIAKVPDPLDWFGPPQNSPSAATGGISMPSQASSIMPDLQLSYAPPRTAFESVSIAPAVPTEFPGPERFSAMPPPPAPPDPPPPPASSDPPPAEAAAATPAPPLLVPSAASPPALPVPPLADAFAALLAAERGAPNPVPAWPPVRVVEVPVVSEDFVEQVTRRVLDRLSDRVVRETVADLVSTIAERLIREEIERIKASLK